ncbi:NAD-dependent epimerase/dehydratase family protein [Tunturibacter empetritectus]|uniref:Nucleoside-diphosphate-sugar epimerase n=1 Tax=Tunturiibacter empetritectus TaxID=3069691 RepID=A0A7W8IGZ1_9BACT|nr:NAD(P)-dependent oxidoreductase [Edaphobacter lichenicola]MBB5316923.1 nucleoside-diphosphate-sugar epimerase [Edaphobacter lichenicola]
MNKKIVITGAAGLVGQNLIPRLILSELTNIVAIDKHPVNTAILRKSHPALRVLECDLADENSTAEWQTELAGCDVLVIGHAQIGGVVPEDFVRNNIRATEKLLEAALRHKVPYLVSISSSVVNSMAVDHYTETKKAQETLVAASGIKQIVVRPTLMFGWFDRKHVGWLARFMQRTPVFPIPGSGKYLRQPLFVGDFCEIIASAINTEATGAYNITGRERIDYIDLIRAVKKATRAKTRIQRIPYSLFWSLLALNALFDRNPAFTVGQLKALVTPDVFEVIDWPSIFGVQATPLDEALKITFCDPVYSHITLDF